MISNLWSLIAAWNSLDSTRSAHWSITAIRRRDAALPSAGNRSAHVVFIAPTLRQSCAQWITIVRESRTSKKTQSYSLSHGNAPRRELHDGENAIRGSRVRNVKVHVETPRRLSFNWSKPKRRHPAGSAVNAFFPLSLSFCTSPALSRE